ncbi:uncharacterized protein G2W53_037624 [Senna tora]|uniref:Uncharacterized protein n=1 Tax=Senna tora TaxID=362788 RepID=A0A834SJN0_9FABA|nr:uncharacterized protein G2W53_037624 [Senna tora]
MTRILDRVNDRSEFSNISFTTVGVIHQNDVEEMTVPYLTYDIR